MTVIHSPIECKGCGKIIGINKHEMCLPCRALKRCAWSTTKCYSARRKDSAYCQKHTEVMKARES